MGERIVSRARPLRRGLLGAGWICVLGSYRDGSRGQAAAALGESQAKAKSVIQVWLWGGACHIDTFDPKPDAGSDYTGPLKSPIATNVDGIRIGELLPQLAKQADKYSLIRSMTHGNNGHETAAYMVQTARQARRPGRVSVRRRGGLAVQGLRRRIHRADSALHRGHQTAGPVFRGGLPGVALQAVCHRRRSRGEPVRRRRRRCPGHHRAAAEGSPRVARRT